MPFYREAYKITWFNNLKNAPLGEKLKLVENFLLFDSFTIRVDNDIFFDPEQEITKQLEINMNRVPQIKNICFYLEMLLKLYHEM